MAHSSRSNRPNTVLVTEYCLTEYVNKIVIFTPDFVTLLLVIYLQFNYIKSRSKIVHAKHK